MGRRPKVDLTKARLRSALTNGKHVLQDIDHRSAEMRRLRDLLSSHVSDLGGEANISHSERLLVSRASMLSLLAEMQERGFVKANMVVKAAELDQYVRVVNTLRRLCETLGLQRRQKDITPDLQTYIRSKVRPMDAGVEE